MLRLRNSFIVRSLFRLSFLAILLASTFHLLLVAAADFLAATKGGHDHLSGAHHTVSGAPVLLLVDFLLQMLVVVTVQPLPLRPNHLLPSRLEFVHVPRPSVIAQYNVPPEVLATWWTFNEAFGGGRPKHHHLIPAEPLTVNDERDSSGSPVFEELFLPPPQKFAAAPPPIVVEFFIINNNSNKRNSVGAVSCFCCSNCSGRTQ